MCEGQTPEGNEVLITPELSSKAGGHQMPSYLIWQCLLGRGPEVCCYFQDSGWEERDILFSIHGPCEQEMLLDLIVSACQIINPEIERKAIHSSPTPPSISLRQASKGKAALEAWGK